MFEEPYITYLIRIIFLLSGVSGIFINIYRNLLYRKIFRESPTGSFDPKIFLRRIFLIDTTLNIFLNNIKRSFVAIVLIGLHISLALFICSHLDLYLKYVFTRIIVKEYISFDLSRFITVFSSGVIIIIFSLILLTYRFVERNISLGVLMLHIILDSIVLSWMMFYCYKDATVLILSMFLTEIFHLYMISRTGSHFIYFIFRTYDYVISHRYLTQAVEESL